MVGASSPIRSILDSCIFQAVLISSSANPSMRGISTRDSGETCIEINAVIEFRELEKVLGDRARTLYYSVRIEF